MIEKCPVCRGQCFDGMNTGTLKPQACKECGGTGVVNLRVGDKRSGWLALAGRDDKQVAYLYEVSSPLSSFWFALCMDRRDAELIAQAYNAHDALVNACETSLELIGTQSTSYDPDEHKALLRHALSLAKQLPVKKNKVTDHSETDSLPLPCILVECVGKGNWTATPITPNGTRRQCLHDSSGRVVMSRREAETLAEPYGQLKGWTVAVVELADRPGPKLESDL